MLPLVVFNKVDNDVVSFGSKETPNSYFKNQTKTKDIPLSTSKKIVGWGQQSQGVFPLISDPSLVIKKGRDAKLFNNEARIGELIGTDHPNFMKVRKLYSKIYPDGQVKYKLVSEKVEGVSLFRQSRNDVLVEFNMALVQKIVKAAFESLRYLDSKEIYWQDIATPGNILFTKNSEIVFVDFADYVEEHDAKVRMDKSLYQLWDLVFEIRGKVQGSPECEAWLTQIADEISETQSQGSQDLSKIEKIVHRSDILFLG